MRTEAAVRIKKELTVIQFSPKAISQRVTPRRTIVIGNISLTIARTKIGTNQKIVFRVSPAKNSTPLTFRTRGFLEIEFNIS